MEKSSGGENEELKCQLYGEMKVLDSLEKGEWNCEMKV
jgi:hypothetical protein